MVDCFAVECPYCGRDSRVLDSRRSGDDVRRRRQCCECGRRFTTYERVAPPEIRVAKRNGESEDFDRQKLLRVLARISRDRPVTPRMREDLVREIEAELIDSCVQVVSSVSLAERVLAKLSKMDRLAAARFCSNYLDEDGAIRVGEAEKSGDPQLELPFPSSTPEKGEDSETLNASNRQRVPRARKREAILAKP
ncbi:MAG: ATP cone domain-containing protein [Pseudomonadota bacterium]